MRSRGFTIVETIFSVAILALIIFLVGDVVSHTLRTSSLYIGRATETRSKASLESRLSEEARSAAAVFIPVLDILGQDNGSSNAHEVDFYRKASDGSDDFVAYRFDRGSGTVTRYDYVFSGTVPQPSDADLMADGIAAFFPQAVAVGTTGDVVGGTSIAPVSVYYGSQQYVGGNGVVLVSVATTAAPGAPAESDSLHLSAKSAPTDLAELVSNASPPPKGPKVVKFIVVPKLMKGSWHGGSDGDPNLGQIHNVAFPGTSTFIGGDGGPVNWFEVSSEEPLLESGQYSYIDANGKRVHLTVSCDNGPCPQFVPLPQIMRGGPNGVVFFRTAQ